jgi:hypothetical protein
MTRLELAKLSVKEDAEFVRDYISRYSKNGTFRGHEIRAYLKNNQSIIMNIKENDILEQYVFMFSTNVLKYERWNCKTLIKESPCINFPGYYWYQFDDGESEEYYFYNGFSLGYPHVEDWMNERGLTVDNWTVEDHLAFTLEFSNKA